MQQLPLQDVSESDDESFSESSNETDNTLSAGECEDEQDTESGCAWQTWDEYQGELHARDLVVTEEVPTLRLPILHKIIGFKWNIGWSIGTIAGRSRRKGFNFMVRYEGEEVEHFHLLHEGKYAFGDDASEGSWVLLSNGEWLGSKCTKHKTNF